MPDEEDVDDSPGLIDLDMGQFGTGTMNDPLRHAMGMRSAQDACKMRMWNGFPSLFQNTIFHGEQDPSIKSLRHGGSMHERLSRAKELKEAGNKSLKSATPAPAPVADIDNKPAGPSDEERELENRLRELDQTISEREQELRELRKERKTAQDAYDKIRVGRLQASETVQRLKAQDHNGVTKTLEDAVTSYEKAAGIFRFVECVRPDWKNDDGSYKGIEDEHLVVDTSALEGDDEQASEVRELVTSCYLNIALASQKLGQFDQMKRACDEVLDKRNPQCVKAFYRRAQARIAPQSAVDADRDAAIQDLHAAAQLAPQDKEVRGLLSKLRAERKAEGNKDRNMFGGFFERGEVVTNDPRTEGDKPLDPSKLDIRDPKVQAMLDIRPGPADYL
jgi:tetratricopeptide (TPR) repeat protein